MASRKGCKSVSTDELVSVEVARLGDTTVSLGGALEFRGGGTFPQEADQIFSTNSSSALLTQANTSLLVADSQSRFQYQNFSDEYPLSVRKKEEKDT